ncbi:hypothetical protein Acr_26g0000270 [Actinidia rufa]|uniref:Uncharacterized protein n=1 Tax=Actinidia rufa TaxID=165716 RepID=A0A7J0H0V9_9ERIC|nr:hypothetical protein Acr_26g0000270 [Actinidia rufa]
MELNQAQQLVHNDAALARFRRDHEILNDMLIEQPCPNEVATTVRGHDDHNPVRTWLIHQVGLRFLISPMLKEVMARCDVIFMQVSMNFVSIVTTRSAQSSAKPTTAANCATLQPCCDTSRSTTTPSPTEMIGSVSLPCPHSKSESLQILPDTLSLRAPAIRVSERASLVEEQEDEDKKEEEGDEEEEE